MSGRPAIQVRRLPGGSGPSLRTPLLALAVAVAFADSSIVVLALPDLLGAFDTTIESVAWVVTSYNLALAVVALGLLAAAHRLPPVAMTQAGLAVFCGASLACALAGDLGTLVAARAAQGVGGALLLAGALPLLGVTAGSAPRGAAVWGLAGVIGAAIGPAAGGALTQIFDWRAIFVAQVPLAAAAVVATVRIHASPRPEEAPGPRSASAGRAWLPAGAGLALVSAALVGALFLAVVLMIDGWGQPPIVAAGVVSALPLATVAAGPVARRSDPRVAVAGGAALVAAGLVAMALLPESSLVMLALALALCGLGVGLSLPALTAASLAGRGVSAGATWSVGARHAGLVLGLVLLTPLLAADLVDTGERARLAGTATLVDAPLPIERKVELGRALDEAVADAPAGELPDLDAALAAATPEEEAPVADLRSRMGDLMEATITRGFRRAFLLCALLAALALAPLAALRRDVLLR